VLSVLTAVMRSSEVLVLKHPSGSFLRRAAWYAPECHEFNLQAAFAASRSGKPGPRSKCGCLLITSPTTFSGVEDAVMRVNPASTNLG
jgi:hypothetical protein